MKRQSEIDAHLAYVKEFPGAVWNVRHIWDTQHGWRLEWEVQGFCLQLEPGLARQLVRLRIAELKRAVLPLAVRVRTLEWFEKFDRLAKEAMHRNRIKAAPAGALT